MVIEFILDLQNKLFWYYHKKSFLSLVWLISISRLKLLNITIIVYFIGNMIEVGQSEIRGKIIEHSWTEIMINELPLKFRILVYLAMLAGVLLSYWYIKFLIKLNIENKKEQKQDKQHNELLEAVKKREDKDIEKYL